MRILVTNDDGIFADGLRILVEELGKIAQVTVVAPDRERSARHRSYPAPANKSPTSGTFSVGGGRLLGRGDSGG